MARFDAINYGNMTKRDRLNILRSNLELERTRFENAWRSIGQYIHPERTRFLTTDVNKGIQHANQILDRHATLASDILRAGLSGGITNPARRWKRMTTEDKDIAELPEVQEWLQTVDERMDSVMQRSNMYAVLPSVYADSGDFATGALLIEEDFDTVFRMRELPIGSYWISENEKGVVDTFMQKYMMTVRQLVAKFGKKDKAGEIIWDNFTFRVRDAWKGHRLEEWVEVIHFILPNEEYLEGMPGMEGKKYASLYYESGRDDASNPGERLMSGQEDLFLRQSGFDFFPVLAPRWNKTGNDSYGNNSPGITALSDVKELQTMRRRKLQGVEKMIHPPTQAPPSMRSSAVSTLPGGTTYLKDAQGGKVEPIYQVNPQVKELEFDMQQTRNRIDEIYMKNMFLMMIVSDQTGSRQPITAAEVRERSQEKMVILGPTLERFDNDLLSPMVDIIFALMDRQGMIPEPPEVIQGQNLKVEYISVMAQAQKLMNLVSMERMVGFTGQLASIAPEVMDKIDADQMIDEYAVTIGAPADVIVSDEEVALIRQQRIQAQQAQAMIEAAPQIGRAAKDLSEADTQGENALTELVGGV